MTRKAAVLGLLVLILVSALAAASPSAAATLEDFGIESVGAEETTAVAGQHPDVTTQITFTHQESEAEPGRMRSVGRAEDISVALPPGLVGNPNAFPRCSPGQFGALNCPTASQVGVVKLILDGGSETDFFLEPLYNLEPPQPDMVARLGFWASLFPTYVDVSVRTAGDYGLTATVHGASSQAPVISATTTLWGEPANPVHDPQRLTPSEALFCDTACLAPGGARQSGWVRVPFTSNATACQAQRVSFAVTSYGLPGRLFGAEAGLPTTTGCESLPFDPALTIAPTSSQAGEPTGLRAVLRIPQTNSVNLPASAHLRRAEVDFPAGLRFSAGTAEGLASCSAGEVGLGTEAASACPAGAKLGSATFVSPALPEPLAGTIYQRTPERGHLFRIWLVTDQLGLHLKIPGELRTDPGNGRLTAVFEDLPQLPVEEIALEIPGGERAPLQNPDACGTYSARYELTPWSGGPPVVGSAPFAVEAGCARRPFSPRLSAGVENPVAASSSPLLVTLQREGSEDNVAGLDVTLPPGMLAHLAGVPLCPQGAAPSGSCPAGSRIGSVRVATGPGPRPLVLPQAGKAQTAVYLAGPYRGAPYSIVSVVPAQAGPFDLGTVVVRSAVFVDPETAQVSVRSDALPQILEGVPILYRTIQIAIDRPGFPLAPTDCRPMRVSATVRSTSGAVAHPGDRFQVGDCAALGFAPKLGLRLQGRTGRGAHPALQARLRPRQGDANIERVSVLLPHSEFLAQEHIRTVCTQVQFNAGQCPRGSVYGRAEARTPLLDQPLRGPVYLRSNGGARRLPDLVMALRGELAIDVVGYIDAVDGRLRTRFQHVPDAPISSFSLTMPAGRKSLLVNSTGGCRSDAAVVTMQAHNGRARNLAVPLRRGC